MSDSVSRRRFLAATSAALGLGPVLAACGGGGPPSSASQCEGYGSLTPEQIQSRQALNYVDQSPRADQVCANCRLYQAPPAQDACGGCQLFAGPVVPKGYCTGWVAAAA